ncbi:MAG: undecaprenyldiphospho-muramoylpentapeptide beta-N-acetylglucosaminyltransferase [Bacillota bacterium]|nr:undecaprenyldiphospho-muramoylpentapeptide beta-N-acetylglucosaminyltransferase [Bacillota bacterium]
MRVIIAGGGTAGHINPGLAIAKYIKQKAPDSEIIFIGTQKGLETKLVPREGFELKLITVRGFKRKLSLDTFVAFKEMFQGVFEARRIIKQFKPDIVIGTGGYVCGPVLFMAARLKIPTLIHEQNAFPGVTNKLLSRFVDIVAISFKEAKKYFKNEKKIILTGNPVRNEIVEADRASGRTKMGISPDKQLVVVVGGSRGAGNINTAVVEMLKKYYSNGEFNIVFATGEAQFDKLKADANGIDENFVKIVPYIYDAADVYSAADLIVCRGGAITMSEITALGLPAVIIPSPFVTANHQEYNARALESQGAAVVILEKDLNPDILYNQIKDLLKDKDQLARMSRNSRKMGILDASEKIFSVVKELERSSRKNK